MVIGQKQGRRRGSRKPPNKRWVNKALKEMAYVLLSRYHPKSTENQRISNQALAPGAKDSL